MERAKGGRPKREVVASRGLDIWQPKGRAPRTPDSTAARRAEIRRLMREAKRAELQRRFGKHRWL